MQLHTCGLSMSCVSMPFVFGCQQLAPPTATLAVVDILQSWMYSLSTSSSTSIFIHLCLAKPTAWWTGRSLVPNLSKRCCCVRTSVDRWCDAWAFMLFVHPPVSMKIKRVDFEGKSIISFGRFNNAQFEMAHICCRPPLNFIFGLDSILALHHQIWMTFAEIPLLHGVCEFVTECCVSPNHTFVWLNTKHGFHSMNKGIQHIFFVTVL